MEEINYLPLQSAKRLISGVVWGGEQGWREREALKMLEEGKSSILNLSPFHNFWIFCYMHVLLILKICLDFFFFPRPLVYFHSSQENRLGLQGLSPRSKTEPLPLTSSRPSISRWLLLCQGPTNLPGMLRVASLLLACTEGYRKKPQNDLKVFKDSISKPCLVFSAIRKVLVVLKFV